MCHWNNSPLTLEREKQFRDQDKAYLASQKPKTKRKMVTAESKRRRGTNGFAHKKGAQTELQKLILSHIEANPMRAVDLYPLLKDYRPKRINENLRTMRDRNLLTATGKPGKHRSMEATGYVYSIKP